MRKLLLATILHTYFFFCAPLTRRSGQTFRGLAKNHTANQVPLAMQESGVVVLMGGSGGGEGAPAPNELRVWPRTLVTGGGWWMEW